MRLSMIKYLFCIYLQICFVSLGVSQDSDMYRTASANVSFVSDAPLELIKASSTDLDGILNSSTKEFAFLLSINSFVGFNNPLQRIHFQENYLESNVYPNAIFKGKILENVDLTADGSYQIRAKGSLNIHGEENEVIIPVSVMTKDGQLNIESAFIVILKDYNIRVPRIVNQKIAERIQVKITATLN